MSVEEWWGRTFEQRGKYTITNLPDKTSRSIQKLSTEDVAELYRSEGVHSTPSVGGVLAGVELRRRENWTARAALVISVLAVFVSVAAVVLKGS